MPAERKPPAEPWLFSWMLRGLTRLVLRFPWPFVALGVVAAVFAMVLTSSRLGFRTSRLDLLNPESGYNRLWIEYINEFGDEDDAVVVVQGANRDEVVPVLEEISRMLVREDQLFHAVLHEVDLSQIRRKGLHYLSTDELHGIERFLAKTDPIVEGDWAQLNLGNITADICRRLENGSPEVRSATQAELGRVAESLLQTLTQRGHYQSPWPGMPNLVSTLSELGSEYLLTKEGRLGFVLLRLAGDKESFAHNTQAIEELRKLIAQVEARHPETRVGLTGLPVMENDEMRASQKAMFKASVLSLVGVACLFIAGFGGVRHPLITVFALLLAMAWSFGYITLSVGHLNILSISFGVILIGLGIDFGVHYVARYLQLRNDHMDCDAALEQTSGGVGPGILTGAITTAIAFFMAAFTDFTGIAELGRIAGGGILLCCLAAFTVLPALVHLADRKRLHKILPGPLDIHGWLLPLFRRPQLLLIATALATILVGLGMGNLWYDHNLLNLQPAGLESVELERKLIAESDQSVWFALSICEDREELLALRDRFLRLESVERVQEIASLFPSDHEQKRPIIGRIEARLANLPERPPRIPIDPPAELGRVLGRAQAAVGGSSRAVRIGRQLEQARDILRRMPLSECYQLLSDYQHRMAGDLLSRLHTLRAMANPEPPQLTDLPESLVTRFVGQRGRYLLKIYSKANIWDMDAMEKFVREVRSVDPRVTGNPLQTYEASRQMKTSYEQAAVYALVAIVIVLYLDFRSLRYVALAMVPLGLGMVQMFGLLGLLDIPLNPANMIVLPLILGIGVDDGVHVVHDFRRQKGPYRMSASTASAVLITSLTTMIGFGSLMIASHQGLQSLGRVLTIGVSCCLFTSLVMLPAVMVWMTRSRPVAEEPPAEETLAAIRARAIRRRHDDSGHPGTSPHAAGQPSHEAPQGARIG